MRELELLTQKLNSVCPVVGVSKSEIGFRVDFGDDSTKLQREAANELIKGWDFASESFAFRLSEIRYAKETAGITVGEQPVTTFRDEMPVWQGMLLDMTLRPGATTSFEYKPRGGSNVTLTPQQVGRIYECFAWYVNACFATERYLVSQIGTLTTEQIIGLAETDSTWPQRQFEWVAPE